MATAAEELTRLKIRANKGEGQRRITIVDHFDGEKRTCSVLDGVKLLAGWVNAGKSEHKLHIVDHAEEKERRLANPKKSIRVVLNCRTPEQYAEFQQVKERYFDAATDPHIAIDLIIRALLAGDPEAWLREGQQDGPPQAEIPSWLK